MSSIICQANANSVLSDGSQARKTGKEKELILVRLVRGGKPIYYCTGLADVTEYGDANAEILKQCVDARFLQKLNVPRDKYTVLMVSSASDGASVNTGIYNGLLTGQKNDGRPWLISIHCVSHRVELSIKDSLLKEERFRAVKQFVIDLFYLFKRSCKIKRHFNGLAATLDVQVYSTLKVHGTRFVNHICSGLARLLNNWPVLMPVQKSKAKTPNRLKETEEFYLSFNLWHYETSPRQLFEAVSCPGEGRCQSL